MLARSTQSSNCKSNHGKRDIMAFPFSTDFLMVHPIRMNGFRCNPGPWLDALFLERGDVTFQVHLRR